MVMVSRGKLTKHLDVAHHGVNTRDSTDEQFVPWMISLPVKARHHPWPWWVDEYPPAAATNDGDECALAMGVEHEKGLFGH